jgi:hypothetical protein
MSGSSFDRWTAHDDACARAPILPATGGGATRRVLPPKLGLRNLAAALCVGDSAVESGGASARSGLEPGGPSSVGAKARTFGRSACQGCSGALLLSSGTSSATAGLRRAERCRPWLVLPGTAKAARARAAEIRRDLSRPRMRSRASWLGNTLAVHEHRRCGAGHQRKIVASTHQISPERAAASIKAAASRRPCLLRVSERRSWSTDGQGGAANVPVFIYGILCLFSLVPR